MKKLVSFHSMLAILFFGTTTVQYSMAQEAEPMIDAQWEILAENLVFPEGPAWDGKETLYFSSCRGEFIGQINSTGYSAFLANDSQRDLWQRTNGLTVGADGYVYACEWAESGGGILRISPDGAVGVYTHDFRGQRYSRPNDLAFDRAGNLYFTDPTSYDPNKPDGVVYRIDGITKDVTKAAEGFCFPNGVAFSADGRALFLAESARHRVLRLTVNEDGSLGEAAAFAEMPGGDPDGMNFDAEGNLWVAHFGGGAIWVFHPDGTLKTKVRAPGKKPSNVEFGGEDMKTLFVTEDETNSVYSTRVETAGLPLAWHPLRP